MLTPIYPSLSHINTHNVLTNQLPHSNTEHKRFSCIDKQKSTSLKLSEILTLWVPLQLDTKHLPRFNCSSKRAVGLYL